MGTVSDEADVEEKTQRTEEAEEPAAEQEETNDAAVSGELEASEETDAEAFAAEEVAEEDITDEEKVDLCEGTGDGRGFAVSGGVAKAVADVIHKLDPEREVKVVSAQGLKDCRKLLTLAKAGKYDGYLLEGMACPGGCVAGAGTLQAVEKSTALVNKYVKDAPLQNSLDSKYEINLDLITEPHDDK